MLQLALSFFIMALLAAFLGFGGAVSYSWAGAKVLFFIFLALAALSYFGSSYFLRKPR
jgi:uncharacterized membrane protein YtjA (UPF0391 family)